LVWLTTFSRVRYCLAFGAEAVVVRDLQQHPGVATGQGGYGHDSYNAEGQEQVNDGKRKPDLVELAVGAGIEEEGIELPFHFSHRLGFLSRLRIAADNPPGPRRMGWGQRQLVCVGQILFRNATFVKQISQL
jgi:hypothetical protein